MPLSGISLIWLGFYLNSLPTAPTTATYAIDGQPPITFALPPRAQVYNITRFFSRPTNFPLVFTTWMLSSKEIPQLPPLTLSVLLVQNDASSSSPSAGTSAGSLSQSANSLARSSSSLSSGYSTVLIPTSSSSGTLSAISGISTNGTSNAPFNTTNGPRNLGSIIGGVIGGLGLVIFVILAILFLCQRSSNRSQKAEIIVEPFVGPSMTLPSPLTQYSPSDNLVLITQQYVYETSSNANITSSLSPLTPNRGFAPSRMIQVDNTTPSLTHGLKEQRKGEEFISRTPHLQKETRAVDLSPSSMTGNNLQSTGLVRDGDTGIQTDQSGYFVELLPPVYSS